MTKCNIIEFRSAPVRDRLYILTTGPSQEEAATQRLAELGFAAYSPSIRYHRRVCGHYRRRSRALIPGYIFALADEVDDPVIRHATGVTGILAEMTEEGQAWIGSLLILESFGAFDTTLDRRPKIKIGDLVRLIGSKWAALGYSGKVRKMQGAKVWIDAGKRGTVSCDLAAVKLVA